MDIWDFDENKNFVVVDGEKVLNKKDSKQASKLLKNLNYKIIQLFKKLNNIENKKIQLLINTPYFLQEMQEIKDQGSIKFEGLNKPKNIIHTKLSKIGKDGSLRAKYRIIFLTIRDSNGKIKRIEELYPLVAHELAHTALNHVKWRKDDHPKDFEKMYNFLLTNFFF